MARIAGDLWKYNLAKVTVVDVSADYAFLDDSLHLLLEPLPSNFYPILKEIWIPTVHLPRRFLEDDFIEGYHYEWHETPESLDGLQHWVVGVTQADAIRVM